MTESSDMEEARTAAMTAVRLIKKHNIQFQLPSSHGSAPHAATRPDEWGQHIQDLFNAMHFSQRVPRYAPSQTVPKGSPAPTAPTPTAPPPTAPPSPQPPPRATPTPPPPPKPSTPKTQPVLIESRYGGPCKSCRKRYDKGEMVYWCRGKGVTHEHCKSYWNDED